MGKGGCFDVYEQGVHMIRSILGCLCCLLCTGPILLIVGIVLLVAPNNFQQNVNTYNSAITTFKNSYLQYIQASSGSVQSYAGGTYTLYQTSQLVPITGTNSDKVDAFTTTYLQASSVPMTSGSGNGVYPTVRSNNGSNTYTPGWQNGYFVNPIFSQSGSVTYPSGCTSGPSTKSGCRTSDFDQKCVNKYGSGAEYYSGGQCSWYQQEKYFCYPLALTASNSWTFDVSLSTGSSSNAPSCDYIDGSSTGMGTWSTSSYLMDGFGQNPLYISSSYSGLPSTYVPIQFRSSYDPYIVASRLTKGTFNFGLTAAQQRGIGAALIAVGCIITAGVVCALIMVKRMMTRDPRNGAAFYGAFGRQYQPVGGYSAMPPGTYGGVYYGAQGPQPMPYGQPASPYQAMPPQQPGYPPQQPGYPPQQPGYPPQQQPYGQPGYQQPQGYAAPPQPGYGQPQPGYGQPPQAYGQPQQTYGQPVPV